MTETSEKRNIVSRRDYLKLAGTAIAGLAIGGAAGYASFPMLNPPPPSTMAAKPAGSYLQGGTLTLTHDTPVMVLDPHLMVDPAAYSVCDNTMDRLVIFEETSAQIWPSAAYSWDYSADGKELTFHLWQGIKFHDGTELTANDVKFSLGRLLAPETKAVYYNYLSWIDTIDVLDKYTVKFTAKQPFALALVTLASPPAVIMNEKRVKELNNDLSSTLANVGSGPFKFIEWKVNDHLTMEANEDYWKGRPYFDKVIFKEVPERTTRGVAVQTGELDLAADIPYDMVDQMKSNKQLATEDDSKLGCFYLGFNCSKDPFKDNVTLRRAIAYGVDYDAVLAQYKGHVRRPPGPYGANLWGFPEDVKGYYYDPELAKKLLNDAGYGDGLDVPLNVTDWGGGDGEIIAASLSKIGVNAKLVHLDPASHDQANMSGETTLFQGGWGLDLPDPDNVMYILFKSDSAMNWVHWTNSKLDELVEKARYTIDQYERATLYEEAYRIVVDQVPMIPLREPGYDWVRSVHVNNFKHGPHYQYMLREVWKK